MVPTSGQIFINGVEIPDTYITEKTVVSANVIMARYKIDGLFNEEKVTYKEKDAEEITELVYNSEQKAWMVETRTITIVAPSNVTVVFNDNNLTDGKYLKDEQEIDSLKTSLKYVDLDIKERTYVIEDVMGKVTVSGIAFNGDVVTPEYDESTFTYTFKNGFAPKDITLYNITQQELIDHAVGYARFVNNDGSRSELILPYVLKGTQVYKDFDDFWVTFSKHNTYWIEDEQVKLVEFYGENLFKATVEFTYWIEGFDGRTDNKKAYDTTVSFWYGKIDGKWKIIDWSLN